MSMSSPPVTSRQLNHPPAVSTPESSSSCCLIELIKSIFKTICCCFFGGDRPAPRPIPNPERVQPSAAEPTARTQSQRLPSNGDGWNALFEQLNGEASQFKVQKSYAQSSKQGAAVEEECNQRRRNSLNPKIKPIFKGAVLSREVFNEGYLKTILMRLMDILKPSVTDLYNYLEIAVASNNVEAVKIMVQIWDKYFTLSQDETDNYKWTDKHQEAFDEMVRVWTGHKNTRASEDVPMLNAINSHLAYRESYSTYPPLLEICSNLTNGAEILNIIWNDRKTVFLLSDNPTIRKLNSSFLANKIMQNDWKFVKVLLENGVSLFKRLDAKFFPRNIGKALLPGFHFDGGGTPLHTTFALTGVMRRHRKGPEKDSCPTQLAISILEYLRDQWLTFDFKYDNENANEFNDAIEICGIESSDSARSIPQKIALLRNAFDQEIKELRASLPEGT